MSDIVDTATRSRMMSGIRGKNTRPERIVRSYLHAHGLRYALHRRDLPGSPDVVLPRWRAVVFVHGCFWHQHPGCPFAYMPKKNRPFWKKKLTSNFDRDKVHIQALKRLGWKTIVVWECQLNENVLSRTVRRIRESK